jgi:hypothetical protein
MSEDEIEQMDEVPPKCAGENPAVEFAFAEAHAKAA